MEGRDIYFPRCFTNIFFESRFHGSDCSIRKRQTQHTVSFRISFIENIRDTECEHLRLPRPWSSHHHHWPLNRIHRFLLCIIELFIFLLKYFFCMLHTLIEFNFPQVHMRFPKEKSDDEKRTEWR